MCYERCFFYTGCPRAAVSPRESATQLIELRLGGEDGQSWADQTALNVMVDLAASPGAISPFSSIPT